MLLVFVRCPVRNFFVKVFEGVSIMVHLAWNKDCLERKRKE